MTRPYLVHILNTKQDCMQNIPGHFHLKKIFFFFSLLWNFKNTQPRSSLPLLDLCIFESPALGSHSLEEEALQESRTPGVLLEEQAVTVTGSPLLHETGATEGLSSSPVTRRSASWERVRGVPRAVLLPSGCILAPSHHICYLHGSCSQKRVATQGNLFTDARLAFKQGALKPVKSGKQTVSLFWGTFPLWVCKGFLWEESSPFRFMGLIACMLESSSESGKEPFSR